METKALFPICCILWSPHSLGTLIEWKLEKFRDPKLMTDFYKRDPGHFNFVLGAILHEN